MDLLSKEFTLLIIVWFACESKAVQFRRVEVSFGNKSVIEDVMYDRKGKLAILNVPGDDDPNTPICHTSNLHDLKRGITALKNVRTGKCYLTWSTETLAEMDGAMIKSKWENGQLLSYKARQTSLPSEDVNEEAGPKIAEFCKDYDTRWIDPVKKARRLRRATRKRRHKKCWTACWRCAFDII